jgi:hypothetical protein
MTSEIGFEASPWAPEVGGGGHVFGTKIPRSGSHQNTVKLRKVFENLHFSKNNIFSKFLSERFLLSSDDTKFFIMNAIQYDTELIT